MLYPQHTYSQRTVDIDSLVDTYSCWDQALPSQGIWEWRILKQQHLAYRSHLMKNYHYKPQTSLCVPVKVLIHRND